MDNTDRQSSRLDPLPASSPTAGRPGRAQAALPAAQGDVLHAYMRSIRDTRVLSRDEQVELAETIRRHADDFRDAMLGLPRTAQAVLERWQERRRTGRVTASLSAHFRDPARPRAGAELDAALAPLEALLRRRRHSRDVRTRRRLDRAIRAHLERAELAIEVLMEVHAHLLRGHGPARRSGRQLRRATAALRAHAEARQRFVTHNLKLVVGYARAFQRPEVPLLDLIQEGNLGLMRAVEKFDHRLGYTFSTYAVWWIQQAMVRAIQKHSRTVRVPSHVYDLQLRHRRAEERLRATGGAEPGRAELAAALGLDAEEMDQLDATLRPIASTSRPLPGADDLSLEDTLADHAAPDPVGEIDRVELGSVLAEGVRSLPVREQRILAWRFGLGGGPEHTLEEVGRRLGLSRERVRQIEQRALLRLRERDSVRGLAASLG